MIKGDGDITETEVDVEKDILISSNLTGKRRLKVHVLGWR